MSALLSAFGGVGNHLLIGARTAGGSNFFALDPLSGAPRPPGPYVGGGVIGAVSTAASVDYTRSQVYFASLRFTIGAPTLWCVKLTVSGLGGSCWSQTSPTDISGGPVERNGVVYVGDSSGQIWAFDATSGLAKWPGPFASACGGLAAIKSFVLADRQGTANDLYYATSNGLCAITDNGASASVKWPVPPVIPIPSAPILARIGGVAYVYVGSSDGHLYQIEADNPGVIKSVLLQAGAQIGAPSFDVRDGMIYVGSEAGAIYAVQAPIP